MPVRLVVVISEPLLLLIIALAHCGTFTNCPVESGRYDPRPSEAGANVSSLVQLIGFMVMESTAWTGLVPGGTLGVSVL